MNILQVLCMLKVVVVLIGDELVDLKEGFILGKGQVRFVFFF